MTTHDQPVTRAEFHELREAVGFLYEAAAAEEMRRGGPACPHLDHAVNCIRESRFATEAHRPAAAPDAEYQGRDYDRSLFAPMPPRQQPSKLEGAGSSPAGAGPTATAALRQLWLEVDDLCRRANSIPALTDDFRQSLVSVRREIKGLEDFLPGQPTDPGHGDAVRALRDVGNRIAAKRDGAGNESAAAAHTEDMAVIRDAIARQPRPDHRAIVSEAIEHVRVCGSILDRLDLARQVVGILPLFNTFDTSDIDAINEFSRALQKAAARATESRAEAEGRQP